jgi:TonB family protein
LVRSIRLAILLPTVIALVSGTIASGQNLRDSRPEIRIRGVVARFDQDWGGTRFDPKEASDTCGFLIFPYVVQLAADRALVLRVQAGCSDDVAVPDGVDLDVDGDRFHLPLNHKGECRVDTQGKTIAKEMVPRIASGQEVTAALRSGNATSRTITIRGNTRRIFGRIWAVYRQDKLPDDTNGRRKWQGQKGPFFAGISGATDPVLIASSRRLPSYPSAWTRPEGIKTILQLLVLSSGEVREVSVLEYHGPESFEREIIAAVKEWRFEPARRGNEAVDAYTTQVIQMPVQPFNKQN